MRITSKKLWQILAILLVVILTSCDGDDEETPQPDVVDLSVTNIEVTQAIQTPTNTVALVAQRSTAIRVTLGVTGATSPVANVTGRLHISVNGAAITPAAGLSPINAPFTAPLSPQRANENDTLNFEVMSPTNITASTDVDFRVEITPVSGETNTANNTGEVANLTFVNRNTPLLYFTRLDYTPAAAGTPAEADVQPGVGDAMVRGIYPVNDSDTLLYQVGLFPTLVYSSDPNGNGMVDAGAEVNQLLSFLASCRQLIVDGSTFASDRIFLYGWIAGNPINGNGWAPIGGRVAFGNTQDIRYQRTFAHELGHNFGLDHPVGGNTLDEVGWDVGTNGGRRLPNNPAGNNVTGQVKPTALNDIMVGGVLTDGAWVDVATYNSWFNHSALATSPDTSPDALTRVVVIQGSFDVEGQELLELEPVFRFPWRSQLAVTEQTGRYLVEITDDAGETTTAQFEALLGDDGETEAGVFRGFFELMVPINPESEIASLRIVNTETDQELGVLERSEPPEIGIAQPTPGSTLEETTEVMWEINDPDTPLDDLQFQVAYSPDGGESWVPLAVDVRGTGVTVNTTEIQESRGNGIIRVFVSDGLNTAFADVEELTTSAAQYPAPEGG